MGDIMTMCMGGTGQLHAVESATRILKSCFGEVQKCWQHNDACFQHPVRLLYIFALVEMQTYSLIASPDLPKHLMCMSMQLGLP